MSFIVLLGGLFVISGGIMLEGDLQATTRTNTAFLALGALLASFVGTTGASMLLIRPLLQTNSERKRVTHTVVFFIFLVSNIGGCLTPLGDPPLFLGYLIGVPFTWTLRLAVPWLFTVALVLAIYVAVGAARAFPRGRRATSRATSTRCGRCASLARKTWCCSLGVLARVALLQAPWRELAIVGLAVLSYLLTDRELRKANRFSFQPILEVAALFAGIFVTMLPALDLLRARGRRAGRSRAVALLLGDAARSLPSWTTPPPI